MVSIRGLMVSIGGLMVSIEGLRVSLKGLMDCGTADDRYQVVLPRHH